MCTIGPSYGLRTTLLLGGWRQTRTSPKRSGWRRCTAFAARSQVWLCPISTSWRSSTATSQILTSTYKVLTLWRCLGKYIILALTKRGCWQCVSYVNVMWFLLFNRFSRLSWLNFCSHPAVYTLHFVFSVSSSTQTTHSFIFTLHIKCWSACNILF